MTGVDGGVMYILNGGVGGRLRDFDSNLCDSIVFGSAGFDSCLYLKNRRMHIIMATRAISRLDMSILTLIG